MGEICYLLIQINISGFSRTMCFEIISVQRVNSTVGKKEFCWLLTLFGGLLFREFISEVVWDLEVGLNGILDYLSEDSVSQQMAEDAKDRTIDRVLASLDAPPRNKNLSVTHSGSLSEENNRSVGHIYYCGYLNIFWQFYMLLSI
jgi:hypothetical protein